MWRTPSISPLKPFWVWFHTSVSFCSRVILVALPYWIVWRLAAAVAHHVDPIIGCGPKNGLLISGKDLVANDAAKLAKTFDQGAVEPTDGARETVATSRRPRAESGYQIGATAVERWADHRDLERRISAANQIAFLEAVAEALDDEFLGFVSPKSSIFAISDFCTTSWHLATRSEMH